MIRVQNFESDNLVPVLSGLLNDETTDESYIFINSLLKLLPANEAVQETYLIMATLERLYEVYARTKLKPDISKNTLLETINNNIYEELKENKQAGFKQYANTTCQVELDLFDDEIIGIVATTLMESVETILDMAIDMGYSLNQSVAELLNFQTNYKHALLREAGSLISMISNSDIISVNMHYWGWSTFLRKYRIYSIHDAPSMFNLIADTMRTKDSWSLNGSKPLTAIEDVMEMEETYIENMIPIMLTPFDAFNSCIKFTRSEITVLVAAKATGKTTFASMLAGIALAQDLKVMFYSPEMSGQKLFNENIILSYIRAKYGFAVTTPQVLGLEEPYEAGSEYTAEEKKVIIKMAKEELATSGNYFHVKEYYMYDELESDMRAHVKMFNPDFLFIDHTQEIRGEADHNRKTAKLAAALKEIAKDYGPHCFVLSHPGGEFKKALPTPENPISRDTKIVAWSNDTETLADNIMGAVKVGDNQFKIFYTKIRSGTIPPMYQVFRMIKPQGWFEFRKEDQYVQNTDTSDAVAALLRGESILMEDDEEFDDPDFD